MISTSLPNQDSLPVIDKSVYLDLICSWEAIPPRLDQAFSDIASAVPMRRPAASKTLRLTRAPNAMTLAKLAELKSGAAEHFKMYGLDPNVPTAQLLAAAQALAPYLVGAGLRMTEDRRLTVEGFGYIEADEKGLVRECPESPILIGRCLLAVMAAFVAQDFGVVLRQSSGLRYAFDCSAFEKTPKDVDNGHNHYIGLDFLEWHRRIPKMGVQLATLFEQLDRQFEMGAIDLFTIDLRGRNLYTNGTLVLHRYERDYVVPLRHSDGRYLGFVNFADVFMKEVGEERRPQQGGLYFDVGCPREFHRQFQVIKHAAFRPHPTGLRELPAQA